MDHPLISLIDQAIAKAEREGQFDDLPGAGRPLDLKGSAKDAVLDRMMKEADAKSPLTTIRHQIEEARSALANHSDPNECKSQMKIIADLQTKLAIEIEAMKRFG